MITKKFKETLDLSSSTTFNSAVIDCDGYDRAGFTLLVGNLGALAGSINVQVSNDGVSWFTAQTSTTFTDALVVAYSGLLYYTYLRVSVVVSAGTGSLVITGNFK